MAHLEIRHAGDKILVMDLPEFHQKPKAIMEAARQRNLLVATHDPKSLPTAVCRVASKGWERLVTGGGAAMGVHDRSALILGDRLFLATGYSCVALNPNDGKLLWHQKADEASIFGLAVTSAGDRLIVHGERSISCWTLEGECVWEYRGKDNLSGVMMVAGGEIRIMDFSGDEFALNEDGQEI